MVEINLTQTEADALFAMEKHRVDETRYFFPVFGGSLCIQLISVDKRERFLLDITRKGIDLKKGTYQNRVREIVILSRLDIDGPHRNPDGEEISSPHIHYYREGFGDKWARPVPKESFPNITNLYQTLIDFMRYCHITKIPHIDEGLPYD